MRARFGPQCAEARDPDRDGQSFQTFSERAAVLARRVAEVDDEDGVLDELLVVDAGVVRHDDDAVVLRGSSGDELSAMPCSSNDGTCGSW